MEFADVEAGWALAGEMAPDGRGVAVDGDLGVGRGGRGGLAGVFGGHVCARCGEGIAEGVVRVKGAMDCPNPRPDQAMAGLFRLSFLREKRKCVLVSRGIFGVL